MRSFDRLFAAATVAAALVWAAPSLPAQQEQVPKAEPTGSEDRRPLLDDPAGLARSLDEVRSQAKDLATAAEEQTEARRRALAEAGGTAVADVPIYEDLMRFPDANRGKAVAFLGRVQQAKPVMLEGREATLVHVTPSDAPQRTIAVLTEAERGLPAEKANVRIVGVFLRLAELSETDGAPVVAPLVAAATLDVLPASDGLLPDRSLWSVVRHRSLGVRDDESGLYYRLLAKARTADPAELRRAAAEHLDARRTARPRLRDGEEFPLFVDLFQNPSEYEGQAVAIDGYVREVRTYPAGANSEGLETLYEAWLFTDDSQSNPVVVVASEATPGLPVGTDLQVPVRVVGYFFKAYAYKAQDTPRVAPMILAGRIEVLPEPVIGGPPWWLLGLLAAVFLGLLAWVVRSYFGERRRRMPPIDGKPDFTAVESDPLEPRP